MLEPNIVAASPRLSPQSMFTVEASPLLSRKSTPSDESLCGSSQSESRKKSWFVLLAACLIPFGAHYAKQSLPPLRPLFQLAGTTGYTFGLLLSAAAWPNLLQPFIAGLFVDSKGHEQGAIVFTALALFGHAIFSASVGTGGIDHSQLSTALLGRILFGLGSGGSGVVQGAIIAHHPEEELTMAVGLTESIKYLANWLGKATPVPIANLFNKSISMALWFGCFILIISCLVAIVYVIREETTRPFTFALNAHSRSKQNRIQSSYSVSTIETNATSQYVLVDDRSYFQISWNLIYSMSWAFWSIGIMHLLLSNTHNLFAGFSTSYMVETYGFTPEKAAWIASIDAFLPIFISPLVGKFVDRNGGRMTICVIAALVDCLSFALLILWGPDLPFGPMIPVLLISFSTSSTPTLVKSCIPIVAPRDALGTAFSLYLVFESIGASVGHVGLGYLRDRTMNYTYDLAVLFFVSLSAAIATGIVRWYDLKHLDGMLNGKPRV